MDVLTRLVVMIGLLAVGVGLRHVGVLSATRVQDLNSVAFYGVLPALVFDSTYDTAITEIVSPTLLLGVLGVVGTMAALGWIVHRRIQDRSVRAAATVQSYHTNLGYLGLPIVATALGGRAAGIGSVILGVGALVQVPLTVSMLVSMTGGERDLHHEARRLATNPVIVSLLIGLAVSSAPWTVTGAPADAIALVASTALPIALLCVGGSITLESVPVDLTIVGSVSTLTLVVMPLVAWLVYAALGADPWTLRTAVVMFAAPTAVSTFVYVTEMGGNRNVASRIVFLTTIASAFTLSAWIALVP